MIRCSQSLVPTYHVATTPVSYVAEYRAEVYRDGIAVLRPRKQPTASAACGDEPPRSCRTGTSPKLPDDEEPVEVVTPPTAIVTTSRRRLSLLHPRDRRRDRPTYGAFVSARAFAFTATIGASVEKGRENDSSGGSESSIAPIC